MTDGTTGILAIPERLAAVRARIEAGGRPAADVRIVAVTKNVEAAAVAAIVAAGISDLGENQAQALVAKSSEAPAGVRWHFLGPIQRNKVKALHPHVSLWHAVDRDVAGAEIAGHEAPAPVLVQVNLAGDPRRPGATWDEAPALVDRLRAVGLDVRGLMGVASRDGGPEGARSEFRRLATLASRLELGELSMGMSNDLEVAVQEGATIVRIGTSLFGARPEAVQMRR